MKLTSFWKMIIFVPKRNLNGFFIRKLFSISYFLWKKLRGFVLKKILIRISLLNSHPLASLVSNFTVVEGIFEVNFRIYILLFRWISKEISLLWSEWVSEVSEVKWVKWVIQNGPLNLMKLIYIYIVVQVYT